MQKKQNSRSMNTVLNFTSSIAGQLITVLMQFVCRTVFINTLGKSYLGIGGLFSNILSMLSLAELGFGSAIVFKLYEPIAKDDHRRITSLMRFYKKVYIGVGLVVAGIGICLIPFLPILIKDYDSLQRLNINAVLVFCIYLAQSVFSYLFLAYKQAIIKANQQEYKVTVVGYFFTIGASILQIISLLVIQNFIVYILIGVLRIIAENFYCAALASKEYPYIDDKDCDKLDKSEVKDIFKDCTALFIYKINNVVLKSTDNIVLSAFLGLGAVAVYSNYFLFYSTIRSLFSKVYNSVGHSLGNLHTTHDIQHEYEVFESTMLISAILGGTAFVGIGVVADEFIMQWIGSEWIIPQPFAVLMGLELFTAAFKSAVNKYRTTMGLFQQAKYRPLAAMIINIVVSIALAKPLGIIGIIIGTLVAEWSTFLWYDPLVIHRVGFKGEYSVTRFYKKFIKYLFTCIIVGALDMFVCNRFMTGFGWISIAVHILICGITTPLALILMSSRTQEAHYVWQLGTNMIKSFTRKKSVSKKP